MRERERTGIEKERVRERERENRDKHSLMITTMKAEGIEYVICRRGHV